MRTAMFGNNSRIKSILFKVLPGICLLCGQTSGINTDLCIDCEIQLPKNTSHCSHCAIPLPEPAICGACIGNQPPFNQAIAPWIYQPPIDRFIAGFKTKGDLVFGQLLVAALIDSIAENAGSLPDVLIPVPLHWRKQFVRGFNQSQWLAMAISAHFKIPVIKNGLIKTRHTRPQRQLKRSERQKNLRGSFKVQTPITGLNIALIDDVMTTQSTAEEATRTLLKAGAASVNLWCLARTAL